MQATPEPKPLPLQGIRVVEFTHMVMGPTCGMVLADLGAEVIKVEPLAGDSTRKATLGRRGPRGFLRKHRGVSRLDLGGAVVMPDVRGLAITERR